MNLRAPLLAVLLGLPGFSYPLLTSSPANAQSDATVEMARQRFREGVQYYDQREYEKARLAFLQAYALKPHPSVLLNLAQSELRAGRTADAASHFSQYLRENSQASPGERQEAELGFAAARAKVAEVRLDVDVEGADVTVDGESKGRSPLGGPLYLSPGQHTIEARSAAGSGRTTVSVTAGQTTTAQIRLSGAPASTETPEEGAAAATPARPEAEPVVPTETGEGAARQPFTSWFASQPTAWVGLGIMVVGGVGGAAFALAAKADYDDADLLSSELLAARDRDRTEYRNTWDMTGIHPDDFFTEGPCVLKPQTKSELEQARVDDYEHTCSDYKNNVDAGDTKRTIAIAGFIAGGVGAVITLGHVVYYFAAEPTESASKKPASRVAVVPLASPTLKGLSVVGSF